MTLDLPPEKIWLSPKPAVIRPAEHALLKPGAFRPCTRAERWAILADLVRTRRMTPEQAKKAIFFLPVVGFGAGGGADKSFLGLIQGRGLATNLLVCLDAGDINSYDGSSQTWTNTAPGGVGTDFYRGSGSGSDGADPTFSGTAGALTENEYFSHDGGDLFTEVSSGWGDDDFHKASATVTIAGLWNFANLSNYQGLFSTAYNLSAQVGVHFYVTPSGGSLVWQVRRSGGVVCTGAPALTISSGGWGFAAVSVDADAGASGGLTMWNSGTATFDATYSSPSSSDASLGARIGWDSFPLLSGGKIGALGIWNRALSSTELADLYTQCKAQRWTSLP